MCDVFDFFVCCLLVLCIAMCVARTLRLCVLKPTEKMHRQRHMQQLLFKVTQQSSDEMFKYTEHTFDEIESMRTICDFRVHTWPYIANSNQFEGKHAFAVLSWLLYEVLWNGRIEMYITIFGVRSCMHLIVLLSISWFAYFIFRMGSLFCRAYRLLLIVLKFWSIEISNQKVISN